MNPPRLCPTLGGQFNSVEAVLFKLDLKRGLFWPAQLESGRYRLSGMVGFNVFVWSQFSNRTIESVIIIVASPSNAEERVAVVERLEAGVSIAEIAREFKTPRKQLCEQEKRHCNHHKAGDPFAYSTGIKH